MFEKKRQHAKNEMRAIRTSLNMLRFSSAIPVMSAMQGSAAAKSGATKSRKRLMGRMRSIGGDGEMARKRQIT